MLSDNSPEQIEKANSLIVLPDEEGPGDDIINTIEFVGGGGIIDVKIFEDLTNDQIQEVIKLLLEYTDVYWDIPGRATILNIKLSTQQILLSGLNQTQFYDIFGINSTRKSKP